MKLAILFWFYKEPEVSKNHLELLKRLNPNTPIYGLFGGEPSSESKYKKLLTPYLDDFYSTNMESGNAKYKVPSNKKWISGEMMLLEWYQHRGYKLKWDSIAIVQWDLLILEPLSKLFKGIKPGQVYISGTQDYTLVHEKKWWWTMKGKKHRKDFLEFLEYLKKEYSFTANPLVCLFIFQIFPRIFWQKFALVKNPQLGMLEYKMPTYAKIFKIPFFHKDLGVHWFENKKEKPMNADNSFINKSYIQKELKKKNGWRVFHPFIKKWE